MNMYIATSIEQLRLWFISCILLFAAGCECHLQGKPDETEESGASEVLTRHYG